MTACIKVESSVKSATGRNVSISTIQLHIDFQTKAKSDSFIHNSLKSSDLCIEQLDHRTKEKYLCQNLELFFHTVTWFLCILSSLNQFEAWWQFSMKGVSL